MSYNVFIKNGQGGCRSDYYYRCSCATLAEAQEIAANITRDAGDADDGWDASVYVFHSKAKYIFKRALTGEYIPAGKEIEIVPA